MRNILLCLCTSSFYPFIHSHTLVSSHPLATVSHVVINMRVLVHLLHAEHLFRVLQFLDHHVIYNGNTISCLHRLHELMISSPYHFFVVVVQLQLFYWSEMLFNHQFVYIFSTTRRLKNGHKHNEHL